MTSYAPLNGYPHKLAPHNAEAEQGMLGVLMVDNKALDDVADLITADDFFIAAHQRIFTAITGMVERGGTASPVTLKNYFDSDADLQKLGGAEYLAALAGNVFSIINAKDYALTIRELSRRRRIIEIGNAAVDTAATFSIEKNTDKIIEDTEAGLYRLAEHGETSGFQDGQTMAGKTLAMIEDMQKGLRAGMATGIGKLDDKTGGFYRKEMTVVAGRPGMGKSAFICTVALNLAKAGHPVGVFSLEMPAEQLIQRILARMTKIPVWRQRRQDEMSREDWQDMTRAANELARLPLFIDDTPGLSAHQLRARARRHKRRFGMDVMMIDFLQKLSLGDRFQNKTDKIGEATGIIYNTGKELDASVILLSQLNRGVESRDDKRPELSDLRDSGEIEQDANNVWFLYRDEYYLQKGEPAKKDTESEEKYAQRQSSYLDRLSRSKGKAEIVIAKSRQEQTGSVKCGFNGLEQLFYNIDDGEGQ